MTSTMSAQDGVGGHLHGSSAAARFTGFELQEVVRERLEQRFTVRPRSRARALVRLLSAAICAAFATALIWAVATRAVTDRLWSSLALLDAAAFIVTTVLLVLAAIRAWTIGVVVVADERGARVLAAHETLTRRLGLARCQNLLWGGAHRLAWEGVDRFALRSRVVAVYASGRRRRLAIRGTLPLVHWLNDMLVHFTKDLPAP